MKYVALVNIPGCLPMDDDPPVFDTAKEAWEYLADERQRAEDAFDDWPLSGGHSGIPTYEYSDTYSDLMSIAAGDFECHAGINELQPGGTGTIYGDTPGYVGEHDLGLAYSVEVVE